MLGDEHDGANADDASVEDASEPDLVAVGGPDDSLVDEPDPGRFARDAAPELPRVELQDEILDDDEVVIDDEPEEEERFQTAVVDTRKPSATPGAGPKTLDEKLKRLKRGD